jgi:hypothetical protein
MKLSLSLALLLTLVPAVASANDDAAEVWFNPVSYTHLRAHETN